MSACVIGLLVTLLGLLLEKVDFAPLQAVVAADDRLYYMLTAPSLKNSAKHRVVLVDIDDAAVPPDNFLSGGRIPRAILANTIRKLREDRAAAILVDIDLRDRAADDDKLTEELAQRDQPKVFIPYFLDGPAPTSCEHQGIPDIRPGMLGTPFLRTSAPDSVVPVHAALEIGGYGMIKGTCSVIELRSMPGFPSALPAGAEAVIASVDKRGWDAIPRLIEPCWRLRDKRIVPREHNGRPWKALDGKPLYTWIPEGDLSIAGKAIEGAIVIIGSSQRGAGDLHYTPVGPMTGALIQANLMLDLQSDRPCQYRISSGAIQLGFDILLTLVISAAVAVCWHPAHLKLGRHEEPTMKQRAARIMAELGIIFLVMGIVLLLLIAAASVGAALIDSWRFAIVGSVLGALVCVVMEGTILASEAARKVVERWMLSEGR